MKYANSDYPINLYQSQVHHDTIKQHVPHFKEHVSSSICFMFKQDFFISWGKICGFINWNHIFSDAKSLKANVIIPIVLVIQKHSYSKFLLSTHLGMHQTHSMLLCWKEITAELISYPFLSPLEQKSNLGSNFFLYPFYHMQKNFVCNCILGEPTQLLYIKSQTRMTINIPFAVVGENPCFLETPLCLVRKISP